MSQPTLKYKNYWFRLDKFYYHKGYTGSWINPPEPPELEIEEMSISYDNYKHGTPDEFVSLPIQAIDFIFSIHEDLMDEFLDLLEKGDVG